MRDLHVNIGGPGDRARQSISFQIAQDDHRRTLDAEQIGRLVGQLRAELEQSNLPAEEFRLAKRQLATIEEEARSERPLLNEIKEGVSMLGQIMQTAQGLAPVFTSTFKLLAAAVG